jgi:hypothetical protein
MKLRATQTWERLPDTSFFMQCQSKSGIRICKSNTQPTTSNAGYLLSENQVVDTDTHDIFIGTCWVKAEHGNSEDFEYDARA